MKRKHAGDIDNADNNAVAATARTAEAKATGGGDARVILLDEAITVEAFFDKDCDVAAQVDDRTNSNEAAHQHHVMPP